MGNYNRGFLRRDEYEEEKRHSRIAICLMIVFALAAAGVLVYTYVRKNSTFVGFEETVIEEGLNNAHVIVSGDGFIRYNGDGATGYDSGAKVVWQIAYDHRDVIAASSGEYAVFAGRGSQYANVTNGTGANYSVTLPYNIAAVAMASNGISAYLTDGGLVDHIYLYDISFNLLLDIETSVRKAGFPITMALSPDGHKLVTSYLKVGEEQENWLTFYNFGEVGQNYADRIVGTYSYGGEMIPDIRFLGNERVCAVTAERCDLYKFKEIPEAPKQLKYESGIKGITQDESNLAIVTDAEGGISRIDMYSSAGEPKGSVNIGMDYDTLYMGRNELIVTSGASAVIYSVEGEEKMSLRLSDTIQLIRNTRNPGLYVASGSSQTAEIRLKTASSEIK